MSLSGQQRKELQLALIDAFPNMASLEQMLSFELDKNLRAIADEGSLQDIVFKLIQTAIAQGWVKDLVDAACNSNPGNQQLRAIARGILPNHDPETSSVSSPNISQKQTNQQQKILILTAIPHGLRLDKEIREIEEAIRRATNRDLFEIRIRTAVHPQDIRRAIAEEQPQIVHFCGHGLEDGSLLLEDDGGNNKPVAPEGLASLFKLHADYVNCVLLNACHSEKTAIAISQYINYVIGMNQPIEDKAAIAFAQGFYDGLGYKNLVNQDLFQRAFNEGMVAIQLESFSQGSIPVLKKNNSKPVPDTAYKNKLQQYEQEFSKAIQAGHPITRTVRERLKSLQQSLGLEDEDIIRIELPGGTDYTRLRDLLKAKKWQEADRETWVVMIRVAGQTARGYLLSEDIEKFPCTDLSTINHLWAHYSEDRFGFIMQKQIFDSVNRDLNAFGERIGWRGEAGLLGGLFAWKSYDQLTFSQNARKGHLPAILAMSAPLLSIRTVETLLQQSLASLLYSLFSRVEICIISESQRDRPNLRRSRF